MAPEVIRGEKYDARAGEWVGGEREGKGRGGGGFGFWFFKKINLKKSKIITPPPTTTTTTKMSGPLELLSEKCWRVSHLI